MPVKYVNPMLLQLIPKIFDAEEFNSIQKKSNSDFKHCPTFAYVHKKLNIYLKN